MRPALLPLCGILVLSIVSGARAGEVRVNVGSGTFFAPATVTVNPRDWVTWVWLGTNHSVTSGNVNDCTANGLFNSGVISTNAAFSWRAPAISNPGIDYFCTPHCSIGMVGMIVVSSGGTSVADFRITEVQTNVSGGIDLIEIQNLGSAAGDLGRYRIVANNDTATVPANGWVVQPNARVTIRAGATGAQGPPSNMLLPTLLSLTDTGDLALLAPNTVNGNINDSSQMIDYVQWGAGGQPRAGGAVTAGLWGAIGDFVPTVGAGHSMEFCGNAADHGVSFWRDATTPTFGAMNGCTTPALPITWGKVKVLYR